MRFRRPTIRYSFGRAVWRNSTRTVRLHPLKHAAPRDLPGLVAAVEDALPEGLRVRATGAGHSFSDAPFTEDAVLDMSAMNKVLPQHAPLRRTGHFVQVQAGITVRQLNHALDRDGKSISAMGGFNRQTIAGAILTGTHGSSMRFGAMSNMVRSLVLVASHPHDAKKTRTWRIEPTDGITDPARYPAGEPELVQDDEVFRSVLVSFGAMGIVYSMVLEVEERYYLKEVRTVTSWTAVKQQLRDGLLNNGQQVYVQLNPYDPKGKETALLMTHTRVEGANLAQRAWQDALWGANSVWESLRNPNLIILGHFRISYWVMVWIMNRRKSRIAATLNSAIKAQKDKGYTQRAHKVLYQGAAHMKINAYDTECALPLDAGHTYHHQLDALFDFLRDLNTRHHFHLSAPIGLRFVKGAMAYLTPEHHRDVCYVDCPVLRHAYGNANITRRVQEFFLANGGIPHWGKRNEVFSEAHLASFYPKLADWKRVRERFDAHGVFSNSFTWRMVGR